ncbi:MAG: hypothetical protein ACYC0H_23065, partial [Solirubrobacteraceae bacterium]
MSQGTSSKIPQVLKAEGSNQALVALQVLMQLIAKGGNQDIVRYLNLLQIDKLASDKADSLLARLLTTAYDFSNTHIVTDIVTTFEINFTDRYQLPVINRILMDFRFDDEVVSFVLRQYPNLSYQELAFRFIDGDADPNIMAGLVRLESNRGPLDEEDYRELYDRSIGKNNDITESFFAQRLNETSGYAEVPPWVKNFTESEELPFDSEIILPETGPFIFEIPETVEEAIELLTEGLRGVGQSEDEVELAQMELLKRLTAATPEEKSKLIHEALETKSKLTLADDEDLFV